MRHFVAYHNTDRMGRSLKGGDPLSVVTNKSVQHLLSNTIWLVVGDGVAPKAYTLGSVFVVDGIGELDDGEFKYYARGRGHVFLPPPGLNEMDWFQELFKDMAHFSLGLSEIKNHRHIESLVGLAAGAGYHDVVV